MTENLAPSEISRDKANHSRRKHNKGNSTNVTPAQVHSVAFHSRKTLDPGRHWPSRCFLLSPVDKCASQAASDKVKNELIHGLHFLWVNTRLPLNPVDTYRSQWTEEFHCKSLPWGIVRIRQKSSYSWSLITSKLPICKTRLHMNTTFKSETWTRSLGPLETPLRSVQKNTSERELGGEQRGGCGQGVRKLKTDQEVIYLPRKIEMPVTERVVLCTHTQP